MQKLQGIIVSLILISGVFASSYAFAQAELSAEDDFYSIDEDTILTIDPIGTLLNDTNTDSETFLAVLITDVGFGNLTLGSDGGFTYEPSQNFTGNDSFIYVANNGTANSTEASVTITVNPVNDPPVAQDDSIETLKNTPIIIDVLANDSDVENDPLSIVLEVNSNVTRGLVEIQDSEILYTPPTDFVGTDVFSYMATDGQDTSNSANVTVTVNPVNDPPVAQDDSIETLQNTPVIVDVLANDSDGEDDPLSIVLEVDSNVTKGLVEIQDSKVLYTPPTDFVGTDIFSYMATDGQDTSNSANVTITINPIEDENSDNSEDTILDEIVTLIQELIDQILALEETVMEILERTTNLEDEVSQLREENSALALRISELEEISNNNVLNVAHDHYDEGDTKILKSEIKALKKEFKEEQKQLKKDFKEEQKQLKKEFKEFLKTLK